MMSVECGALVIAVLRYSPVVGDFLSAVVPKNLELVESRILCRFRFNLVSVATTKSSHKAL
jgi:hypothetical protein